MRFTKMQGTGNDFVVVDAIHSGLPADPGRLALSICDRKFGVGADGLVFIGRGTDGDFRMDIWNADGSRAAMCGNASRCVGAWLWDRGLAAGESFSLETETGLRNLRRVAAESGGDREYEVDMGAPRWSDSCLPAVSSAGKMIEYPLDVGGRIFSINCVSMGNPHCVVFADELTDALVTEWGPRIERHPIFPDRANVEFVRLVSRTEARVRVWERGCGETFACGTGASAVCAVSAELGKSDGSLDCFMTGGRLRLRLEPRSNGQTVLMSGPARAVFDGDYFLEA